MRAAAECDGFDLSAFLIIVSYAAQIDSTAMALYRGADRFHAA